MNSSRDISDLIAIMARLRDPQSGCPWDLKQDFTSIAPYAIEEAYEVVDAIERQDFDDLCDELGDLLFQVVFHARMASEAGLFEFGDVVEAITTKMIRRHPHIFGGLTADDADHVKRRWDEIKATEKADRASRRQDASGGAHREPGLLDDVPVGMPALTRAVKLQKRAGSVGFDWNDPRAVIAKIREELDEFEAELPESGKPSVGQHARQQDELGDVLFAVANLGRHLKIDPEASLRSTNSKFLRRFGFIETALRERGRALGEAPLDEMEALWMEAKAAEAGKAS
ncbi:ATP diphosphatase [Faunimonas pinastri]|uniref:Nucleoside triphosphate pyrophosphohydrolase n=1 Tax=Faunimonas pinastri TaxID=1855383 RepID=A0A1H9N6J6_9HYPH|nr:nucleoside triphosphate pyrophosphohydrolase [Faunimonas pinastri]SER31544.1 ATP diphosphatase [Faunimonas pinastri]